LDLATGIGEPAVTAARKLTVDDSGNHNTSNDKNRGYVLATDISTQMLTIAKQRAGCRVRHL
jgi:ubiquinone/menaquinone biosynthesis C-methylase UbiE